MSDALRVLVIDDDANLAETLAESLERSGYACTVANSGQAGLKRLDRDDFEVVLTDLRLGDIDGLSIVRKLRQEQPEIEVIVITGYGDVKTAVQAIQLGAAHYLVKPPDLAELRATVNKSAERLRLARANRELRQQLDEKFGFEGVVGNSQRMHDLLNKLKAFAPTRATVLILGESGTGKELVAKAVHTNSPRKNKPFVAMNCSALNENLLDDEMFGHEPGSFTGADKLRKGRFEHANGGTLFLDEVGDMPLSLQAKLLRVLENGEVTRIGANDPIKVDTRILAATHRNLDQMVAEGTFRQDLYYRLKVGIIKLPPLRERKEDLPLLTAHFLKEAASKHSKPVTSVSEAVRKAFASHAWPGNVRQLRNVVESMVLQDFDGVLDANDLPEGEGFERPTTGTSPVKAGPDHLIGRPLAEVERYYMERALELTTGNREEAAKLLGIGERTLYRVIQDWKLQDKIKQAITDAGGNLEHAASALGLTKDALERKLKKLGAGEEEA
jgi:two-component system response regulator HydG